MLVIAPGDWPSCRWELHRAHRPLCVALAADHHHRPIRTQVELKDTIPHKLLELSVARRDEVAFRWLRDEKGSVDSEWTFGALAMNAQVIAYHLEQQWGCGRGERALLVYAPGLAFVASFLGCLYCGVVAVPVYPPDPRNAGPGLRKMAAHAHCAEPAIALTESFFSLPLRGWLWLRCAL